MSLSLLLSLYLYLSLSLTVSPSLWAKSEVAPAKPKRGPVIGNPEIDRGACLIRQSTKLPTKHELGIPVVVVVVVVGGLANDFLACFLSLYDLGV